MVQPHDIVTLTGIESKDDHEIVQYKWLQLSGSTSAVLEVCNLSHLASGSADVLQVLLMFTRSTLHHEQI